MTFKKFEEILAWQKAQDLAVLIYGIFQSSKDYGFRDQITRAAVSISNNIAEGFERGSDPEFGRFLYISLGSSSEVKSMIYLAERLGYVSSETRENIIQQSGEINKIIYGLIKSLSAKR
jgi:four helix bundle protein